MIPANLMTEWLLQFLWQNDSCKSYDRMIPGNLMAADHSRNGVGKNNFVKKSCATAQPGYRAAILFNIFVTE